MIKRIPPAHCLLVPLLFILRPGSQSVMPLRVEAPSSTKQKDIMHTHTHNHQSKRRLKTTDAHHRNNRKIALKYAAHATRDRVPYLFEHLFICIFMRFWGGFGACDISARTHKQIKDSQHKYWIRFVVKLRESLMIVYNIFFELINPSPHYVKAQYLCEKTTELWFCLSVMIFFVMEIVVNILQSPDQNAPSLIITLFIPNCIKYCIFDCIY